MKMTIRDVISKLHDIDRAVELVESQMPDDKPAYVNERPKDAVIDLLEEYAEMIRNIKIDI